MNDLENETATLRGLEGVYVCGRRELVLRDPTEQQQLSELQ